jgi:hypothetical protein
MSKIWALVNKRDAIAYEGFGVLKAFLEIGLVPEQHRLQVAALVAEYDALTRQMEIPE